MKLVYLLVSDDVAWEDIVVVLTEDEAIQLSMTYPKSRVEIFSKHPHFNQYIPTYNYYKNGEFYTSSSSLDI